jgi:hypothetical protein
VYVASGYLLSESEQGFLRACFLLLRLICCLACPKVLVVGNLAEPATGRNFKWSLMIAIQDPTCGKLAFSGRFQAHTYALCRAGHVCSACF